MLTSRYTLIESCYAGAMVNPRASWAPPTRGPAQICHPALETTPTELCSGTASEWADCSGHLGKKILGILKEEY